MNDDVRDRLRGHRRFALMHQDGEPPVAVIVEDDDDDDENFHDHLDNENHLNLLNHNELDWVAGRPPPPPPRGNLRGRNAENISSLLFDSIREGTATCINVGWTEDGCHRQVTQCRETPDQAFYTSPHSGRTPLHEACLRSSCSHIIKALLNANPIGAMERDHSGNYPLHLVFIDFSYRFVSLEEMQIIVQDLLNVNPPHLATAINGEGNTPLHMACNAPDSMINTTILTQLIQANPTCASMLNNRYYTPLHLYSEGRNAQSDVARTLLDAHPEALQQQDHQWGWTPLHVAAHMLNTDLIVFFVQCNPDVVSRRDRNGRTALHILCPHAREAHIPAICALLQAGGPDMYTLAENVHGQTPLHIACRSSRPLLEVIRLVGAQPQAAAKIDHDNYTPLHHACEAGADHEIIAFLLQVDPSVAGIATRKQDTAIHIACGANKSTETVKLLIEANRQALVMTNDYGFTPLHCVCRAYQPRMGIVQALLEASPSCVTQRTHGGETPIHLACSSAAFVGVLQLLTQAQNNLTGTVASHKLLVSNPTGTNKVGNTPLHEACFRGASFEHIETLAKATPSWIVVRNNAGYTPLQVMCKGGRLDERVVTAFSRIRGPEVFSVMDSTGHTPLHSACREGTNVAAIRSLVKAFPDALHAKTTYGDTPLHLACFRGAGADVVREVAESSCDGRLSTLLEPNTAGQSPIGIAMEEFQNVCTKTPRDNFCCVSSSYSSSQARAFDVLAALVKILFYGVNYNEDEHGPASLVKACVCLHRRDVRLDPAFIRRAIHLNPEELRIQDEEGNYPLHIEASIPVEKMSLLDGPIKGCCAGKCHKRAGLLGTLLFCYPEATHFRNTADEFPLGLMIRNGRLWDQTFAVALRHFPPAMHWYKGMDDRFVAHILAKVRNRDTLYELLTSRPDIVRRR